MKRMTRLGVALGGGGARGLAHLGVLIELLDAGIHPEFVAGTSMGAIVGAAYAVGQDLPKLLRVLAHLELRELLGVGEPFEAMLGRAAVESLRGRLRRRAWHDEPSPRLGRMAQFLKLITKGRWFEDLKIPFVAVAADYVTGEEVRIDEGPVYHGVAASAALPGLVNPVPWRKRYLVDGGLVNNLPVDVVEGMGAWTVLAVDVRAPLGPPPATLVGATLRFLEIATREAERVRVERARDRLGDRLLVVHPDVDEIGVLDFDRLEEAVAAGRECARSTLARL